MSSPDLRLAQPGLDLLDEDGPLLVRRQVAGRAALLAQQRTGVGAQRAPADPVLEGAPRVEAGSRTAG